jgi:type II secretory pathway component GspD/PulD (secretin)
MDCRLTYAFLLAVLIAPRASADPAQTPAAHEVRDRQSAGIGSPTLSVHWEGLPLRDAVARLAEAAKVKVFIDRRVDPSQRVDLSADNQAADEILAKLASSQSLGTSRMDSLFYLGPTRAAAEFTALAELRRAEVSKLSPQEQGVWSKKTSITWPRLTTPRDLVTQFAQDHGLQIIGAERIPYDLWPAGDLPKLALADQLTVLLFGFDLTYRPLPGKAAIEVIPISETMAAAPQTSAAPAKSDRATSKPAKANTKQLYTLRVREQPISKVLDQLSGQLHLDLKVDAAAIQSAGRSLDERVSFEVKDADLAGLLQAVLEPAGLTFSRERDQITIIPK